MKNKNIFSPLNSISDIVDAMVSGLEKEWVKVNLSSFGSVSDGICYGCAATNTLCEINQKAFTEENIGNRDLRAEYLNVHFLILLKFETAINYLRKGDTIGFMINLEHIESSFNFKIPEWSDIRPENVLPQLYEDNYMKNLVHYKNYANWLRERGF